MKRSEHHADPDQTGPVRRLGNRLSRRQSLELLMTTSLAICVGGCGGGGGGSGGGSGSAPPSPSGPIGLGNGTNLRTDGNAYVANFRDPDGVSYDARQLQGTSGWLVEAAAPLDGMLLYGQSNSGLFVASDTNKALRSPQFPHTVVGSSLGFTGDNTRRDPGSAAASFVDLFDAPSLIGHYPATLDAYAAERVARDAGRPPTGIYAYTQYQGGQPITEFVKASVNYNLLLSDVRRTTATARLYKRDFAVRGIIWIQGETATLNYGATLEKLADDLAADIMAITGQATAPELMIQQINAPDDQPGVTGVELDQVALARKRFGRGITLIGPMYQGRFPPPDNIHVSDLGKMALADVAGLAFDRIRRGLSFTPLWPVSAVRDGAVIDLKFALPGKSLAFDTDLVPPTPNQGFVYRDDNGSAEIVSVEIVGADIVRLTLSREPTGANRRIEYALANEAIADGFASGRGNLYSEDSATSVYARLGYPVPNRVRHYAVRFLQLVP